MEDSKGTIREENPKELLSECQQFLSKILNNQSENDGINLSPAEVDLPIDIGNITKSETAKAIEQMKTGKAPGCDPSIAAEALKHGGETVEEALYQICSAVFTRKIPPSRWIRNIILPLPKKKSLYEMTTYRGITLMSIAAKVYNGILLNRIRPLVDPTLRHNQAGFRTGRSCTQQVFILRRLIKGADDQQLPLSVTFIDFKKTFDSIIRNAMFKVLRHYGIPETLAEAIKTLCINSKIALYAEEFENATGVLRGDVLASFLFVIMFDFIMKQSEGTRGFITAPTRSSRYLREVINDLGFADHIAFFENSLEEAQFQLNRTAVEGQKIGLKTLSDQTIKL